MDELFEALMEFEQYDGVVPAMLEPDVARLPRTTRLRFRDRNYASADAEPRSEFDVRREYHDMRDLL